MHFRIFRFINISKILIIFITCLLLFNNTTFGHDKFNLWDCFVDEKKDKCLDFFKNSKILYPSMGLIGKWE